MLIIHFVLTYRDRLSLCNSLGVLELALVDQTGIKLTDIPAPASQVLELKACATTALLSILFHCTTLL